MRILVEKAEGFVRSIGSVRASCAGRQGRSRQNGDRDFRSRQRRHKFRALRWQGKMPGAAAFNRLNFEVSTQGGVTQANGPQKQRAPEYVFDNAGRTAEAQYRVLSRVYDENTIRHIEKDGERVLDVLPEVFLASLAPRNGHQGALAISESPMEVLSPPPWESWRDNFIQDAQESLARSPWEQLSPEPALVNLDTLDLKRFESLAIPATFIFCRHDKAMPPGYFYPGMSSRLGTFKLFEMDGSHEVMFTRPAEVAEKLVEASLP